MAIDARLREGLQRSMSVIDADAERRLTDARRRGRRRVIVHRTVAAVAVAATIVVFAVTAPAVLDALRAHRHVPATTPSPLAIAGTYTTTIASADAPGVPRAAGTWLLTLSGDGQLDVASLTNGDIGRSVTPYQITGDELLTTAFGDSQCSGVGRYTVLRSRSSLTIAVVSDPCPLRVAIFSSHPWTTA